MGIHQRTQSRLTGARRDTGRSRGSWSCDLKDTCPEVTPYNRTRYNHLLTNLAEAEHYLTSGLNRMPTSVMRIEDCVSHAFDPTLSAGERPVLHAKAAKPLSTNKVVKEGKFESTGRVASQTDWSVQGKALVTDVPIIPRLSIETPVSSKSRGTHWMASPYPIPSSSIPRAVVQPSRRLFSWALIYTGMGPRAIVNRDVCPLTLPAASLLNVPYAHGFDERSLFGNQLWR